MYIIENKIEINTTPSKIWNVWLDIENTFKYFHPEDHIQCKWVKGEPMQEGSVCIFEQYIGNNLDKSSVKFTRIIPQKFIQFMPINPIIRFALPKIELKIIPENGGCTYRDRIYLRFKLLKYFPPLLFKLKKFLKHTHEEGQYLKKYLEN